MAGAQWQAKAELYRKGGFDMTAEQQARDMLERMGIEGAQQMTAGDLVELANLIARSPKMILDSLTDEQRLELFSHYCTSCGCMDPRCQCWNDE